MTSLAGLSLMLIPLSGCSSSPPDLPDRAAPAVKAEEARLAALLSADRTVIDAPGVCTVRLLGQEAGASFVWASCQVPGPNGMGVSAPFRVDGSKVTAPKDGAGFSPSVREMFPEDLAEFVLNNPSSPELRPSATPTPPKATPPTAG